MKKLFTILFSGAIATLTYGQASLEEAKQYIEIPGSVQNVDKKVFKKPETQFMPYCALKFRTGTSKTARTGKGKNVAEATAYAVLDGVDEKIFQEITDEFYKRLVAKMKEIGIEYLPYDKIKESKTYNKYAVEPEERHYNDSQFGTSDVFTQNNVPLFKYPTITTKVMKMQKELDAALSTLRLTVNFVEFDVDIKKKYGWTTVTTSANADAQAAIKIECKFQEATWEAATAGSYYNTAGFLMSNSKLFAQKVPNKDIYEPIEKATITAYDDKIPKYANRKWRAYKGGMQLGSFIVEVDPQEYKKAALKALDRYIDYLTVVIKSYQG